MVGRRPGWTAAIAAVAAVIADLALTGFLHVDGLVDAGDGLLPPLPRERRLEVMSDPHAGAFGVVTVVVVLLLRVAAFASVAPAPVAVVSIWAASRTVMALTVCRAPMPVPTGASVPGSGATPAAVLVVAAPCVLVPAVLGGVPAIAAAAVHRRGSRGGGGLRSGPSRGLDR